MEVWISRHLGRAFTDAVLPANARRRIDAPDIAVMLDTLEKPGVIQAATICCCRPSELRTPKWRSSKAPIPKCGNGASCIIHCRSIHYSMPSMELSWPAFSPDLSPSPGSPYTPNASCYRTSDFRLTGGPSFRMVLDVGNWDNSRAVNYPGQSGNPDDTHYRDLRKCG